MRETRRFRTWSDDGREIVLVEYTQLGDTFVEPTARSKPRFLTSSGEPVRQIAEGVYQLHNGLTVREWMPR